MTHPALQINRRCLLKSLSVGGIIGLSGCEHLPGGEQFPTSRTDGEEQSPTTVIFTDGPTETETQTENRDVIVFAGGDGTAFSNALKTVAEFPGSRLKVEPGTYNLEPDSGITGATVPHFRNQELNNVTIEGNGATLKFSDPTLAGIDIFDSSDLVIRDLTLDYDPVPFTQGVIRAIDAGQKNLIIEIDDGFPLLDHDMFSKAAQVWASVHTQNGEFVGGIRRRGDPDKHFQSIEPIGDRRFNVKLNDFSNLRGIQENRKLAIVARDHFPVLRFYKVNDLTLENVTVHSSKGGVFSIQLCENPIIRNCTIAPAENSKRLIGANRGLVLLLRCGNNLFTAPSDIISICLKSGSSSTK